MKKRWTKIICLFIICSFSSVFFTGCTNAVELENLGIILALGFEAGENTNFKISVQLLDIDSKINDNKIGSQVYEEEGGTIIDAIEKINKKVGRKFNFSHAQYVVIEDSLARKGIGEIVDFLLRFNQIRPDLPILITESKVEDILMAKVSTNKISAFSVNDLNDVQRKRGYSVKTTIQRYISNINAGPKCDIFGVIRTNKNQNENYIISGLAVFKEGKLIGYFSQEEARGVNFIKGKISKGIVSILFDNNNNIGLEIYDSSSKIETKIVKGKLQVKVKISVKSNIYEVSKQLDFVKNPQLLSEISKKEDEVIYAEVKMAIYKAQKKLGIDALQFGENLYRKKYSQWKSVTNQWDKIFKEANIQVEVVSKINQTGGTNKLKQ